MLQKDPSCRASLEEIEAHHWLQGLDNALLSPEAPPHWLSGGLSPSSPRAGLPECGDLLAARPPSQQGFPGHCQPNLSFTLHPPPTEDPAVNKNLPGLQQICEEDEEEDMEEMLETVISDQPVSQTSDIPTSALPGFVVQCCQGLSDSTGPDKEKEEEIEPNNNTHNPPPVLPAPSIPASSVRPNKKDEHDEKTDEGGTEDLMTDRSQTHNAPVSRDEAAPKAEQGKRHSMKLHERLFQFPLCEKALAFNTPTHNKPKILPLSQYNCCRVL